MLRLERKFVCSKYLFLTWGLPLKTNKGILCNWLVKMYLRSLQHRDTKENNPDVHFEFTPENLKVR
jgi:hypothetical protein